MKKTIKLSKVINAFSNMENDTAIIVHVFNSIKEFKRKIVLKDNYKNLTDIYQMFLTERKTIVDSLLNAYLEKENKDKNKKLTIEDFPQLPASLMPEFSAKINKLVETEVEYNPFKFSEKEIEDSGISISEMILLEDFF